MTIMPFLVSYSIFITITSVIFLVLARNAAKTIAFAARSLSALAEGEAPVFSASLSGKHSRRHERLYTSLDVLAKKLAHESTARRAIGQGLYSVGNELELEMSKAAIVVKSISNGAKIVNDQVIDQSSGIEETSVTIRSIMENLDRQNDSVASQASAVGQTAAAVEQMIANAKMIAHNTTQMDKSFGDLQVALKNGNDKLSEMIHRTTEIAKHSDSLQTANTVIATIADQTNLLAMNAAIEAAHAGDYGKGFSVVSQEIRKLAESSARQSKQIADTIKTIRLGIAELNGDSAVTDQAFAAVREQLAGLSILELQIKKAMDEQGEGDRRAHV